MHIQRAVRSQAITQLRLHTYPSPPGICSLAECPAPCSHGDHMVSRAPPMRALDSQPWIWPFGVARKIRAGVATHAQGSIHWLIISTMAIIYNYSLMATIHTCLHQPTDICEFVEVDE